MSQIRELPVTELAAELQRRDISLSNANIWDVRDHPDYVKGHLEGAVNRPVNQGFEAAMLTSIEAPVYLLCGGGSKAPRAAKALQELDNALEIVILTGGTRLAKSAGLSIITGEAVIAS